MGNKLYEVKQIRSRDQKELKSLILQKYRKSKWKMKSR